MLFFMLCGAREGGFGVIAFYCGLVWVENEAVAQGLPQRTEAPGRGCVKGYERLATIQRRPDYEPGELPTTPLSREDGGNGGIRILSDSL